MDEKIIIAPTKEHSGDWLGFERVVDTEDANQIEEACRELERYLKEET